MQIHCPICSTAIDVPETHIGQKGRCMKCQTKFLIPPTPEAPFEILERGAVPAQAAASAEPPKAKAATKMPVAPAKTPAKKATPALKAAPPAVAARQVSMRHRPKKGGAIGFWIVAAAVGIVMVALFPKLAGNRGETAKGSSTTPAPKGAPKSPGATTAPDPTPQQPAVPQAPPPDAGDDPDDGDLATLDLTPPEPEAGAGADSPPTPPPLEEEKKARALAYLKSDEPNKRQGAYTALRKLGDPYKEVYEQLLGQAKEHHLKQLGDKAFNLSVDNQSLTAFEQAHDQWRGAAETARKLVQTNWKGKVANDNELKQKHAEMDGAFTEAETQRNKLAEAVKKAGGGGIEALEKDTAPLTEIGIEFAWCRGENEPKEPTLRDQINEAGGADTFLKLFDMLSGTIDAEKEISAVEEHNRRSHWATSTYKSFAKLLNGRRAALGLQPLRLEEKLSNACEAHSGDMHFKGYFSHTGADGSSFGQRAKRAGFTGSPRGECIFTGSSSPDAAHRAWWYSDGHRTIMYSTAPNTLGLGSAAGHWTLNTAKMNW